MVLVRPIPPLVPITHLPSSLGLLYPEVESIDDTFKISRVTDAIEYLIDNFSTVFDEPESNTPTKFPNEYIPKQGNQTLDLPPC